MFTKLKALDDKPARVALCISFLLYSVFYIRALLIGRDGFVWMTPERNLPMEHMFMAIYFVHGLFLLMAARAPRKSLSLIDYSIVSGVLHGLVMYTDATRLGLEANLKPTGDVWATFLVPVLLIATHPRRFYLGDLFGTAKA